MIRKKLRERKIETGRAKRRHVLSLLYLKFEWFYYRNQSSKSQQNWSLQTEKTKTNSLHISPIIIQQQLLRYQLNLQQSAQYLPQELQHGTLMNQLGLKKNSLW